MSQKIRANRNSRLRVYLFSFSIFIVASSLPLYSLGVKNDKSYIIGTWSDACPCHIPCTCWGKQISNAQWCINFHVFSIRSGSYNGVDLSGSVFVLLNLPSAPGQVPHPDSLFISTGDARKAAAIQGSLKQIFGFAPPHVLRTHITYGEEDGEQRLSIPSLLLYSITFQPEQRMSADVSENLYGWASNARQGKVESVVYSPAGSQKVEYSNTNAISARFRIPVPINNGLADGKIKGSDPQ
jgi:hypothetical protein